MESVPAATGNSFYSTLYAVYSLPASYIVQSAIAPVYALVPSKAKRLQKHDDIKNIHIHIKWETFFHGSSESSPIQITKPAAHQV